MVQVAEVAPYTPLYPEQVEQTVQEPAEKFSMSASNVLMTNRNSEALLSRIEEYKPDLILLTEPDQTWIDALKSIEPDYPYRVLKPIGNTYGMALYSKLELIDPQIKFLIEDDIPSIHTKVLLPSGKVMMLYCVHPKPPAPQESDSTAQRDGELMVIAGLASKQAIPVVVAGDLNDVAWSDTTRLFRKISGLLDPRIGRGFYNTFHADYPFLRFPLDHFFHSAQFRLVHLERLSSIDSDHLPIMITLAPGEDSSGWGAVEPPTAEEKEQAEEAVVEGVQAEALDKKEKE